MKVKNLYLILILAGTLLLGGCATTEVNKPLSEQFWQTHNQKVMIAMVPAPEPGVYKAGQQGVLDILVNGAMNSKLEKHLKTLELSWYHQLAADFSTKLEQHQMKTLHYKGTFSDKKDDLLNRVASEGTADKLLVIKLQQLGVLRRYYSVIPTGAPKGHILISGTLFDVATKQVLWSHSSNVDEGVKGDWDTPPNYPALTDSVNRATAVARQEILDSFFSGL